MKSSDQLKLGTTICGTAIILMMLYTDGPVAAGIAAAAAAATFGITGYLGKKPE